tara:strand:- start:38 stop:226 length:189 start_codon:yes stop_codon:yes gene_type:complete
LSFYQDFFFIFFHSDFEISVDVALKVFADIGATFDETLAIIIKQINKIAKHLVRFILWDSIG